MNEFEYSPVDPIQEDFQDFQDDISEVDDYDYLSADDDLFFGFEQNPEQNPEKRLPGRPRIERTGQRGRP